MKISSKLVNVLLSRVSSTKKYKNRDQWLMKLSKKLLNPLGVLKGKLTLGPPTANNKRFKPPVVTFMNIYFDSCVKNNVKIQGLFHVSKPTPGAGLTAVMQIASVCFTFKIFLTDN